MDAVNEDTNLTKVQGELDHPARHNFLPLKVKALEPLLLDHEHYATSLPLAVSEGSEDMELLFVNPEVLLDIVVISMELLHNHNVMGLKIPEDTKLPVPVLARVL